MKNARVARSWRLHLDFKGKPGRPGNVWQGQDSCRKPEKAMHEAVRVKSKLTQSTQEVKRWQECAAAGTAVMTGTPNALGAHSYHTAMCSRCRTWSADLVFGVLGSGLLPMIPFSLLERECLRCTTVYQRYVIFFFLFIGSYTSKSSLCQRRL
jgi:hypothetical protein